MGIFPFQSPEEQEESKKHIQHFKDFVASKGYKDARELESHGRWYKPLVGPFLAPDGITYEDEESFRKGYGYGIALIKDGVYYGYYEIADLENYKDLWHDELHFLEVKGYRRIDPDEVLRETGYLVGDDYLKAINAAAKFYEDHHFVPRWEKDGKYCDHRQALNQEGYVYDDSIKPSVLPFVPAECPFCKTAWRGGCQLPNERYPKEGVRVFYNCGASLSTRDRGNGHVELLAKNCTKVEDQYPLIPSHCMFCNSPRSVSDNEFIRARSPECGTPFPKPRDKVFYTCGCNLHCNNLIWGSTHIIARECFKTNGPIAN